MTTRRPPGSGLLRWFPPRWRHRYGDEFAALIEDELDGRTPTPRFRLAIVAAGLRERGHESGLAGHPPPAAERVRTGSLLVLCAWAAFMVAGGSLVKAAEHFQQAIPAPSRALSVDTYDTVAVVAVIAGLLVVAGAVVAVPAFRAFLAGGGWASMRRPVVRAGAVTAVTVGAGAGLRAVAQHLTAAQRNGTDGLYSLAFVAVVLLLATSLGLWTAAAVAVVRRLGLSRAVLGTEAVLATTVTAAMVLMTAATAVWWASIATTAPWFLQGTKAGSPASAFAPNLAVTMALMLLASAVALYGAARLARSWAEMPTA
jgi:hypothetical protein